MNYYAISVLFISNDSFFTTFVSLYFYVIVGVSKTELIKTETTNNKLPYFNRVGRLAK